MSKINLEDLLDDDLDYDVEEKNGGTNINWSRLFAILREKRKSYFISIPVAFVIACLIALSIPKTYTVQVTLAPEFSSMSGTSGSLGSLSSLMRSFGIGGTSNSSGDAILPNLYPDLMNSKLFLVSLFDIPVESKDKKIKTTYYDYLANHQKSPWWSKAIGGIMSLIPSDNSAQKEEEAVNAGALTRKQSAVVKGLMGRIISEADKKTGVITITVSDQDPVICTTIADSTCQRLQEFITEYRTKKTRQELVDVQKQYDQSVADYEEAKHKVEAFNDGNWDLVDEDFLIEKQALQNDMQLKFSTMSAFNTQLLAARSKYESSRPVFTVLDGASVPLRPTGPKKKGIVIGIVFLAIVGQTLWILRKSFREIVVKEEEA